MPWQMKEVIATGGGHTKYKLVNNHLIITILVMKSTFCQGGAIFLAKMEDVDRVLNNVTHNDRFCVIYQNKANRYLPKMAVRYFS